MSQQDGLSGINTPNRVKYSYTQSINGTPEQVFPLLCPVGELDWAPGWSIDWVISTTGRAEQECMFQTPPLEGSKYPAIWIVTEHDPDDFQVVMYKVTPGLAIAKLAISLTASGAASTKAQLSYELTALGTEGDAHLAEFTTASWEIFMLGWEAAMNYFLKTGERLGGLSYAITILRIVAIRLRIVTIRFIHWMFAGANRAIKPEKGVTK